MLRLQGLQPSSRQFDEWREAYGDLFTRQQFVEAMVRPRPSRPALASPAPAQLPPPPTPLSARPFPAQMGFVSSRQMSFKTTEWSSSKVCCTRIDCIPLGADEVTMTPDTFTIEQTQSPWCFCGLKRLSNSTSINIETCRTRWIHAHVPLMPLHWFSSYLFEGVLIYLGVAVLGAWTDSGYEDSVGRASQLDASAESLRAIRDVWFGGNLVAGTVACLLWWLFRLALQIQRRSGHAYVFATGCTIPPPDSLLSDGGRAEGKFAIGWSDCEKAVDQFLVHKGCFLSDPAIEKSKELALEESGLQNVLMAPGEELHSAEFVMDGLKKHWTRPDDLPEDDVVKVLVPGRRAPVRIAQIPSSQMVDLELEAGHIDKGEDGDAAREKLQEKLLQVLMESHLEQCDDVMEQELRQRRRKLGDKSLKWLRREAEKHLDGDKQQPAETDGAGDAPPDTPAETLGEEEEQKQLIERLVVHEATELQAARDEHERALRQAMLDAVSVSRSEQLLSKVTVEEYCRAANQRPVYIDGDWQERKNGGRWYAWKRWWVGEETSLYIGEHTFKAGTVTGIGPVCRRREHLAAQTEDLIWVHSGKHGRSCARLSGWLWTAARIICAVCLVLGTMWSLRFPDCDRSIGCDNVGLRMPIGYSNCVAECAVEACENITCARHLRCDDLKIANISAAAAVNQACAAAGGVVNEQQCASALDVAETAQASAAMLPASCSAVYDDGTAAQAYKLFLDLNYLAPNGGWLGPVAHLGDEQCAVAAAVEKCSGCTNASRCEPSKPSYPSTSRLCSAILEADELVDSEFCYDHAFGDKTQPCMCMSVAESLIPDWAVFATSFVVLFVSVSIPLVFVWLRWIPEKLDLGVAGMKSIRSTSGFVLPPGKSVLASIDLLETRLGRVLSVAKVHKPWVYQPGYEHLASMVFGFEESMTVYEDFVHVNVHKGVCCCCSTQLSKRCCCDAKGIWADQDNYFLLLDHVSFIELGSEYYWPFNAAAKLFAWIGTFFLVAEWVFMEPVEMFEEVYGECVFTCSLFWDNKYGASVICLAMFGVCRLLAGNFLKRGYVSIHCQPGGTDRGRESAYVGRSPFFVRLGRADPEHYREDIDTIRSAVKKCRVEVKERHEERVQKQWSLATFKQYKSATVKKAAEKLKASAQHDDAEQSTETARMDLIDRTLFNKKKKKIAVEVELEDKKRLDYYEIDPDELRRKRRWLAEVPLFEEMEEAFLEALAKTLERRPVKRNATIIEKGTAGNEMCKFSHCLSARDMPTAARLTRHVLFSADFVVSGEAEVLHSLDDESGFATLDEGSFFGEASLVSSEPRNAFVRATEKMELYVLSKTQMEEEFESFPGVKELIEGQLEQRKAERLHRHLKRHAPLAEPDGPVDPTDGPQPQPEPEPEPEQQQEADVFTSRGLEHKQRKRLGCIDMRLVNSVRIVKDQTPEATEESVLVISSERTAWHFECESEEQEKQWQQYLEDAMRAAQHDDAGWDPEDRALPHRLLYQRELDKQEERLIGGEQDQEVRKEKQDVRRIFVAVDKNRDQTVSFNEFSRWLNTAVQHLDVKSAEDAVLRIKEKYKKQLYTVHSNRLTLEEFWDLMKTYGVMADLHEAGLWKHLAMKHLYDAQSLGATFRRVVRMTGREGDEYIDVNQLTYAFQTMDNKTPPAVEIAKLLRLYDRSITGKLTESQFVELMLYYLNSTERTQEFAADTYCPVEMFGMQLDVVPWGEQITHIKNTEIVSKGNVGPFNVENLSTTFMTSWEHSRSRWLHAVGNPLDAHKLVGYLAESLLLYAVIASDYVQGQIASKSFNILGPVCCGFVVGAAFTVANIDPRITKHMKKLFTQDWHIIALYWTFFVLGAMGAWWWWYEWGELWSYTSAHYLVRVVVFEWWAMRVFLLVYRKIGRATVFTLGQPLTKKGLRNRQEFPVQIQQLEELSRSFGDVKGFSTLDIIESYREGVPGYGFIPHDLDRCQCHRSRWWTMRVCSKTSLVYRWVMKPLNRCRGIHTLYVGKKHFEIERNGGGGWKTATRRSAGWRARCTQIDHITGYMEDVKWIHVRKEGKSLAGLVKRSVKAMVGAVVVAMPLALLFSYPCSDQLNLRGTDAPLSHRHPEGFDPGQSWENWTTYNSSTDVMSRFDGAKGWCDAFHTTSAWYTDMEPSVCRSGRPCVCPQPNKAALRAELGAIRDPVALKSRAAEACVDPENFLNEVHRGKCDTTQEAASCRNATIQAILEKEATCNPNLDPSVYFGNLGQMKWCGAWAQGEQFWVPLELQRPRQAKDTSFIDSLRGVLTGNLDVFNLDEQFPWSDGNHPNFQPSAMIDVAEDPTDDSLLAQSQAYRRREQPCECLTPMSTAFPEVAALLWVMGIFAVFIQPVIIFKWIKYAPWKCELGVAGLGSAGEVQITPEHAMHRLFRRRQAVELSQNIQRLNNILMRGKQEKGSKVVHGLDNSTLILTDIPAEYTLEVLRNIFKQGHRLEFLGIKMFPMVTNGDDDPTASDKRINGAIITVRDHLWVQHVVYRKGITIQKTDDGKPFLRLTRRNDTTRAADFVTVLEFPVGEGSEKKLEKCIGEKWKQDFLGDTENVDAQHTTHNAQVDKAFQTLHQAENEKASFYRHMSAVDQADSLFDALDQDQNGFLTAAELEGVIEGDKQRRKETLAKFLKDPSYDWQGKDLFARKDDGRLNDDAAKQIDLGKLREGVLEECTMLTKDLDKLESECRAQAGVNAQSKHEMIDRTLAALESNSKALAWVVESRKASLQMSSDESNPDGAKAALEAELTRLEQMLGFERMPEAATTKDRIEEAHRNHGFGDWKTMQDEYLGMDESMEMLERVNLLVTRQMARLLESDPDELQAELTRAAARRKANEKANKQLAKLPGYRPAAAKGRTHYEATAIKSSVEGENETVNPLASVDLTGVDQAIESSSAVQVEDQEGGPQEEQEEPESIALLREAVEEQAFDVEMTQGLAAVIAMPGWLEALLGLIIKRMKDGYRHASVEYRPVKTGMSMKKLQEQIAAQEVKNKDLKNGGHASAEADEGLCSFCRGGTEEEVDEGDEKEGLVGEGEETLQHLKALLHKAELEREAVESRNEDKMSGGSLHIQQQLREVEAEIERTDPTKAQKELRAGQRIIKTQFRRWFLEYVGGEEQALHGEHEPRDWCVPAEPAMPQLSR